MSMKLQVHPLVVAAALGMVGPAALAEDDAATGLAGVWKRAGDAQVAAAPLGTCIEVIPFEDRLILDPGLEGDEALGTWTRADDLRAVQSLVVGGRQVEREFAVDGDALQVRTRVDGVDVGRELFRRVG
jgi:hypothetical protein